MSQALHLPPAEIERRILANIAMYHDTKHPNATSRMLLDHWSDCLQQLHAYQEGRINLADLHSDVRSMGWKMPEWGYRRD